MSTRCIRLTGAFMLAVLVWLTIASTALAAPVTPEPVKLSADMVEPLPLGASLSLSVRLSASNGTPIADQPIKLYLDGAFVKDARTDEQGVARYEIKRRFPAGTYRVQFVFRGTRGYTASVAMTTFTVGPSQFQITTVPPVAGVQFKLDDRVFTTDNDGIASIEISRPAKYRLEIQPFAESNVRAEFARWADEVFVPARDVTLPAMQSLQVGLLVSYRVQLAFSDPNGTTIDAQRVASTIAKGSTGGVATFTSGEPSWLVANRVFRKENGLKSTAILYGVQSVTVDGVNVVNQGEQRFFVTPEDTWNVALLLYSTRISVRDALLRRKTGSGVEVSFPNGAIRSMALDDNNELALSALARGDYSVRGIGPGYTAPTPLKLSRDQNVDLLVISYFDLALVFSVGLIITLGLLLFGRPGLLPEPLRRSRRVRGVTIPGWIVTLLIVIEYCLPLIFAGYVFSFVHTTPPPFVSPAARVIDTTTRTNGTTVAPTTRVIVDARTDHGADAAPGPAFDAAQEGS